MSKTSTLSPDVLIVGSGLIGAVYARKLVDGDPSLNVLMVDIGNRSTYLIGDHKKNSVAIQKDLGRFTSTIQGAWSPLSVSADESTMSSNGDSWPPRPYNTAQSSLNQEQSPGDNLSAAVAVREVGGMGSYWTCATPEQHPSVERSDIFSDRQWKTLYKEAKALFRTTTTAFDHSVRQSLIIDALRKTTQNREFTALPLACQRNPINPDYVEWTSTATILGNLASPNNNSVNFELLEQHCCMRLCLDAKHEHVTNAELLNLLTNEVVVVQARKYIICAGAVLSAGILFNSGIRPDTGYPALGRYMTEQVVALCQVILKQGLIESVWDDPRSQEHFRKFPEDPLRLPYDDPDPQITCPLTKEHPWHAQIHRDAYGYGLVPLDMDQRLALDLRFFTYVEPEYENRVEFSPTTKDKFGMPQPTFHYQIGKDAARRACAMMDDMAQLASTLGDFRQGSEPRLLPPGAALHICGTTRVGKVDDGQSVLDAHSRVWRIDNLVVGGCGVIPTQNASNPTLTAACFAIASVQQMLSELKGVVGVGARL